MKPIRLTRRAMLVGLSTAGFAGAARAQVAGFAANLAGATTLPRELRFARASPGLAADAGGVLRQVAADAPRFDHDPLTARPLGLLIEGAARNHAAAAAEAAAPLWRRSGAIELRAEAAIAAPDGGQGAWRVAAAMPRPGAKALVELGAIAADQFATASLWLRAAPGQAGRWRLGIADGASLRGRGIEVELDERWRRFNLPMLWEYRDTGPKRIEVADLSLPLPAGHLREALLWGIQYEAGNSASSLVASGERAADVVTLDFGAAFAEAGTLRLHLPSGGRRGGVVLDGPVRLDYSESGWIGGRVGRLALRGFGDATADTHLELTWSRAGATLRSGRGFDALTPRAGVLANPGRIEPGVARLFAASDGSRALDRHLGGIELWAAAGPAVEVAAPRIAPAPYRLVFADEFTDPDVARINENATGGRPGAPAWRSRYHHPRADVINREKQIYMDVAYAGTDPRPLGVQPFSIRDGVLSIRAERADARIRPFLHGQAYTSGCITSENTHWQTYGYFEMGARLPLGKGFWPAFWLLPKSARWPPEIDVFECSGVRRMSVRPAVHWVKADGGRDGYGEWFDGLIDIADGFHVYGCEWTREAIAFFVDGAELLRRPNPGIHEDMYLLANLALGSGDPNWIPDPDDTTPFPGVMQIDFVRAYARG